MATSLYLLDYSRDTNIGTIGILQGLSAPFINLSSYSAVRKTLKLTFHYVSSCCGDQLIAEGQYHVLFWMVHFGRFVEIGSLIADSVLGVAFSFYGFSLIRGKVKPKVQTLKISGDHVFVYLSDAQVSALWNRIQVGVLNGQPAEDINPPVRLIDPEPRQQVSDVNRARLQNIRPQQVSAPLPYAHREPSPIAAGSSRRSSLQRIGQAAGLLASFVPQFDNYNDAALFTEYL
jgi:hypothetical protein